MASWLASQGTDHQYTAPNTSAHIGWVERMHRTLMAKAQTMWLYANLPSFLWDEFCLTASHLHAKTTTRSLHGKTPWELWYGQKPDYSYMRKIGCRGFVLILNRHNPKIYERSIECVLIGYDPKSKSYRCYHRESTQVYSSYHVQFLESHHSSPFKPALSSSPASPPSVPLPTPTIFQPLPTPSSDPLPSHSSPPADTVPDSSSELPPQHNDLTPAPNLHSRSGPFFSSCTCSSLYMAPDPHCPNSDSA